MMPSLFTPRVLMALATLSLLTAGVCAIRRAAAIRDAGAGAGTEPTNNEPGSPPGPRTEREQSAARRPSPAPLVSARVVPALPTEAFGPTAGASSAAVPAALPDLLAGAAAEAAGNLADDPRVREFAESITRGRGGNLGVFEHIESALALSDGQRELFRGIAADYVRDEAAAYAAFLRGTLGEAERAAQTAWARQWAESRVAAYLDAPQLARFDTLHRFTFVRPDNRAALTAIRGARGGRPAGYGPPPVDGLVAPPPAPPPSGPDDAPHKASG